MEHSLITIVGPTAIGKTAIAITLAKYLNTEILSCDSRQFFKEMCIGTAIPSALELRSVPHHFIQHISVNTSYSVGDFERESLAFIENFFKKKQSLIMVGGSGLYEKAITEGLNKFPSIPANIREDLNWEWKEKGIEPLQKELRIKDIEYYNKVALENPHRLIRALEVIRFTGKPYSYFLQQPKKKRSFRTIKIGLFDEREKIYQNINQRVEAMMESGLLHEAERLYPYRHLNALNTVGYKELFDYFDGKMSLEKAIDEIKKNTRRFAKRQLTWYRKDKEVQWFKPTEIEEIKKCLNSIIL